MRLKCAMGHLWDPAAADRNAPLVCPTCGKPPQGTALVTATEEDEKTLDAESTLDAATPVDADRTVDLPTPTPATDRGAMKPPAPRGDVRTVPPRSDIPRSEVTQTLHFTPPPKSATGQGAGAPAAMPFAIVRQHAKGGLGVVSLARDLHIKREVALKQILPQHIDNATLQRRFLYEAQITGQLEHPSIVPVYSLGNDDVGNPYYVMRFVKGRTLDEIIKEHHQSPNPIVFRELLRRFIAVCQAVAYAHSQGVIHRDLKPANVMLGDYGETLVLDWGLAKDIRQGGADPLAEPATLVRPPTGAAAGATLAGARPNTSMAGGTPSAELTMQGQIIGTPAYMAPEQAEGKTELHKPATDIYALGGILYKILTGQSPQAPTASHTGPGGGRIFTFVASPPPSKVAQNVPPALERVCTHAMQTDPGARYPRALELAQEIQRWLDENPLVVPAHTTMGKVKEFIESHAFIVIGTMAAVLGVMAAVLVWRRH